MRPTYETSLKDWITGGPSHDLADFLHLFVMLTVMVEKAHKQNEMIGAMTPANIRIQMDTSIANITEIVEWRSVYKSPEQTGRINRTPDKRSDLYVLGVLFYEILTGQLPYRMQEGDDWGYAHISELPQPIIEMRPEVEGPLQRIVMKLLEKSPENRYQRAYGLLQDLKQCQAMLQQNGALSSFEIGEIDKASTFAIPDVWFGRSDQRDQLQLGLEQVISGHFVSIYVTGSKGVGKTSLIQQFKQSVIRQGGRFVEGKCEPSKEQQPLDEPLLQVLGQWIEQLWSEPSATILAVKNRFNQLQLLEEETKWLTEIFPGIHVLLSEPVNPLIGAATDDRSDRGTRLSRLFPLLIRCFVESLGPLVIFVDDWQYADDETRVILERMIHHEMCEGLMIIVAQEQAIYHNDVVCVSLSVLCYDDVRQWLSSMVYEDTTRTRLLARAMYDQTEGNPRALRQLLKHRHEEQKLYYDEKQHRWMWDAEILGSTDGFSDNFRLYREGFDRLPEETKHVLMIAAAIGPNFSASTLAEVMEYALTDTLNLLKPAVLEGIICNEDEVGKQAIDPNKYMFLYRQVQQMVYQTTGNRPGEWHLKIGRVFQRSNPDWLNSDAVLDVIDQLNLGMQAMTDLEKLELRQYNFHVGTGAYYGKELAEAKKYFKIGLLLVNQQDTEPDATTCEIMLRLAICEHITGNIEQGKQWFNQLVGQAHLLNPSDRLLWHSIQIEVSTFEDSQLASQIGSQALAEFGWKMPRRVSSGSLLKEIVLTQVALYKKRNQLRLLPINEDEDYLAMTKLILGFSANLLMYNPQLYMAICAKFIRYGLKRGTNEPLMTIVGIYEAFLKRGIPWLYRYLPTRTLDYMQTTVFANMDNNYRFPYVIGLYKQLEHPMEASGYLNKAMRRAFEFGDTTVMNLAIITCIVTHNESVHDLNELLAFIEGKPIEIMDDTSLKLYRNAKAYCQALQDETVLERYICIDAAEDREQNDNYSCINKLEVGYVTGKYAEALCWAKQARQQELDMDWVQNRKLRVFEALSYAASYRSFQSKEQGDTKKRLKKLAHKMQKWIGYFGRDSAAHLLIRAEWKRISGDKTDLRQDYETVIEKAEEEQQGLIKAISCERLADYYTEIGSRNGAAISWMDACMAYSVWGVSAKVSQIKRQYPDLWWYVSKQQGESSYRTEMVREEEGSIKDAVAVTDLTDEPEEELLDQIARWAGEQSSNLLDQFLAAAVRQLGADRGYVFRNKGVDFHIEAQIAKCEKTTSTNLYPAYMLRQVDRTGETVMLDDATQTYYVRDPYLADARPCSTLCIPVRFPSSQSSLLLYLENSQVTGVFTSRSLSVLELMIIRLKYLYIQEELSKDNKEPTSSIAASKHPLPLSEPLTNREIEVLITLTRGLSNKEIAGSLGISEATVKTHIVNIYSKLGVNRRAQAVIRAKELQIV